MQQTKFLMASVMGHPIMHLRSPVLHNYWLKQHGLTGGLRATGGEARWTGSSSVCVARTWVRRMQSDHAAQGAGAFNRRPRLAGRAPNRAMNWVVAAEDGSYEGHNFEAFGYAESLSQEVPGWRADAGPVVIMGAGGGARRHSRPCRARYEKPSSLQPLTRPRAAARCGVRHRGSAVGTSP
jgi:shikimate dehydrogenase